MTKGTFDREAWIARRIWDRIHIKNRNALVGFFALPGEVKSYGAIRLCELIDPTFNLDRIVFEVHELLHLINARPRPPRGAAFLLDDTARAANSRKWQSDVNQALSDIGNTFRYRGYLVCATARVGKDIDSQFRELFHVTFEMKGSDLQRKFAMAKPMVPSMDTARGKTYWHYPRALVPGRGYVRLKRIPFHPSHFQTGHDLTWPAYERKKDLFMSAHYRKLEKDLREERRAGGSIPDWSRKTLILLIKQGMSQRAIAREIGISQAAVSQFVSQLANGG